MLNLLLDLAQALNEAQIPYMIIGGQAVLVYGEPRLTRDIDITLGLTPDHLPTVLTLAQKLGLKVLVEQPEAFVHRTWALPCQDPRSGLRVDFIFSWTPYEQQAIAHARPILVEGTPVHFATPEDVIIHKVLAGRPRDLEDVRSILRKQRVNTTYITKWLRQFEETLGKPFTARFSEIIREGGKTND